MDETTYRRLLTQCLNEYWGACHEVLEAQSVNARMLADPHGLPSAAVDTEADRVRHEGRVRG